MVTSNLDMLGISIDGTTQEVYEKYRVGGNLEKVFNNLKKLVAAKKLYKSNITINWDFIVMKHNEHQVEEAKVMAKGFGIPIEIKEAMPDIKGALQGSIGEMIDTHGEWLPDNPKYNPYDMKNKKRKSEFKYNIIHMKYTYVHAPFWHPFGYCC